MTDTTKLIGQLVTDPSAGRDAIHIAVVPLVAAEKLQPGQHVSLTKDQYQHATHSLNTSGRIGIVDPFLTKDVEAGQRCFVFLYPLTITGLRHVWTHPLFDRKPTYVSE